MSQLFTLTVHDGYGSGIYNKGDTIHVWSKAVFSDTVFVDWTGNGSDYLTCNSEWHTALLVPQGTGVETLTITANFDAISFSTQIDSTSYLLFGENDDIQTNVIKETFYAIPPNPKGIVFLLHGTGGQGQKFFSKYERYTLIKDLVFDGFAVFTLDANERTMGDQNGDGKIRWDNSNAAYANSSNNVDILNIESLRDSVINTFSFSQNIPSYTLGMSAGAVFSDICASALGYNASAHITAKGKTNTYTRPDIAPVIWIMSENDHNESADNEAAHDNFSIMNENQTAEWHLFKRSPVFYNRFIRSLYNISEAQSDSVFQRLESNAYLDDDNFLTLLDMSLIPPSLLDNLGLDAQQKFSIRQQLLCVNADHILHSDYNKNIIRFFNQLLSPLSINMNEKKVEHSVYPNPFHNIASLEFEKKQGEIYTLKIFNTLGNQVRTVNNMEDNIMIIQRGSLAKGLYFYQLFANGKPQYSGKIIIE